MTTQEMRELDAWIAVNLFNAENDQNWQEFLIGNSPAWNKDGSDNCFSPTTDPAAAMEVLKKCYDQPLSICTCKSPDGYKFWLPNGFSIALNAPTLELAICQFAKKLFTK